MTVHDEIQQIVASIPNVRWVRIIHNDGLLHSQYDYNSDTVKNDPDILINEDRFAPMASAGVSLSERIGDMLDLGKSQYTIISGVDNTNFMFWIGDGTQWLISFAVDGEPSIDRIVAYFKARDFLANIVPKLESRSA